MYLGNKSCHLLARQLLFHELGIHTETAKPAAEPPQHCIQQETQLQWAGQGRT